MARLALVATTDGDVGSLRLCRSGLVELDRSCPERGDDAARNTKSNAKVLLGRRAQRTRRPTKPPSSASEGDLASNPVVRALRGMDIHVCTGVRQRRHVVRHEVGVSAHRRLARSAEHNECEPVFPRAHTGSGVSPKAPGGIRTPDQRIRSRASPILQARRPHQKWLNHADAAWRHQALLCPNLGVLVAPVWPHSGGASAIPPSRR